MNITGSKWTPSFYPFNASVPQWSVGSIFLNFDRCLQLRRRQPTLCANCQLTKSPSKLEVDSNRWIMCTNWSSHLEKFVDWEWLYMLGKYWNISIRWCSTTLFPGRLVVFESTFPSRCHGRRGAIEWPPLSPDLYSVFFFVESLLKNLKSWKKQ